MSRAAYFQKLSFLESSALMTAQPAVKALRKWRNERPQESAVSLVAPHAIDLVYLREAVEATGAEVVVFRTPADLSPSATNRALIASLLGERGASIAERVAWEPQGLWEPQTAAAIARDAGALLVVDPLAADPLQEQLETVEEAFASGQAYLRPAGIGSGRRRFRDAALEELTERVVELDRGWVAFANPDKLADACAFAARVRAGGEDAPIRSDDQK
jgi:hypothetical protein